MPDTSTDVCRAADVQREDFSPCKVVLKELVMGDPGVVYGTARACLPVRSVGVRNMGVRSVGVRSVGVWCEEK